MPYKEHTIEKKYFTITDVAADLEITTSKLRYYEDIGIIYPDKKKGVRLYKAENVEKIRMVMQCAKTKQFTCKGLKFIYHHKRLPTLNDLI